jgi:uncharacterized membrane protein required for colicin V production
MVSLNVLFWMLVILFAVIGAMRGWAKELMVTFSVILALFIITVLENFVPMIRNAIAASGPSMQFWIRATIVILLSFFGYQTPNIRALAGARFARERLQDTLLGFLIGAFNGYLIVGTIWWFMHNAGYPFPNIVYPPAPNTPLAVVIDRMIGWMPPDWLVPPWIYFAVGVAFLFVIVVFI